MRKLFLHLPNTAILQLSIEIDFLLMITLVSCVVWVLKKKKKKTEERKKKDKQTKTSDESFV